MNEYTRAIFQSDSRYLSSVMLKSSNSFEFSEIVMHRNSILSGKAGIMIPLYIYPCAHWSRLKEMKIRYPSVPFLVIINPNNGPGDTTDSNYVSGVDLLHSAGITVLGYVHTKYGTRPELEIISEIELYRKWYNLDGIMFDEVSSEKGYESYYLILGDESKRIGCSITVGNPGTCVPQSYGNTMDVLCVYESPGLPHISNLSSCKNDLGNSDSAVISYRVRNIDTSFIQNAKEYVNWLYITDCDLPNPYERLPSYLEKEVAALN